MREKLLDRRGRQTREPAARETGTPRDDCQAENEVDTRQPAALRAPQPHQQPRHQPTDAIGAPGWCGSPDERTGIAEGKTAL